MPISTAPVAPARGSATLKDAQRVLRDVFGYDEFRPGQPGLWPLGLGLQRDGLLYVPRAALTRRVPLLVMLHGAGSSPARIWTTVQNDADERDVAVLMPASRESSWDFTQ